MTEPDIHSPKSLRDLYPHFTEEQVQEAEHTLGEYVSLVWRICERVRLDHGEALLTDLGATPYDERERST